MRVILVDDEVHALDVLEILLLEIGGVTIAGRYTNPLLAIKEVESLEVDAVFLDIQMPGMMGIEVASTIMSKFPNIHVIFTTSYANYAIEAFELESLDYLLKPFSKERLEKSLQRLKKQITRIDTQEKNIQLEIQCLGNFCVRLRFDDNRLLTFKTNKEMELLAFLLHHLGTPVNSDVIIEALWPESDLEKAKNYLYTCISYLRKTIKNNHLPIELKKAGRGYMVISNGILVDVHQLTDILDQINANNTSVKQNLKRMKELYQGDYLERCDYKWAQSRKLELHGQYIKALQQLAERSKKEGDLSLTVDCLQQIMLLSPNFEEIGRELILIYLETGNTAAALQVYKQLEEEICSNLGLPLQISTKKLYEEVIGISRK